MTGFVRAFVDELPSPFNCLPEMLSDRPFTIPFRSNQVVSLPIPNWDL